MRDLHLPDTLWAGLRQPAYTHENRCLPCTAVNLVLAAGLTSVVGLASVPGAIVVAALSLAAIYFRGYLVPGTPELTARYLPVRVHRWFEQFGAHAPREDAVDVAAFLHQSGVVHESDGDVRLAPTFDDALAAAADALSDEAAMIDAAATVLDVAPARVSFAATGPSWRVLLDESPVGQWESRAAFLTDLAAYDALTAWTPDWLALPDTARGRTLTAIRACLTRCPVCAGKVELGTDVVGSCCREYEVVAATCTDCNARFFEIDATAAEGED